MINLKLAQYNEKGEFEKFLELDIIQDQEEPILFENGRNSGFILAKNAVIVPSWKNDHCGIINAFIKDEKDPLNRFDGLFDGRTYGNGRFVLITEEFEHFYQIVECTTRTMTSAFYGYLGNAEKAPFELNYKVMGNIIENPELWSKIK